jgi:hypothetical protein
LLSLDNGLLALDNAAEGNHARLARETVSSADYADYADCPAPVVRAARICGGLGNGGQPLAPGTAPVTRIFRHTSGNAVLRDIPARRGNAQRVIRVAIWRNLWPVSTRPQLRAYLR